MAQRSAGDVDQYLRGEGGIVDLHVEREELIVRATRDTFTREVHTVTHIVEGINRSHGLYVRFVVDEIGIGLDGGFNSGEISAGLEFDVDHTAVNAGAEGDGDRKGIANAIDSANGYRVSHGTAGTEIRVAHALRGEALHEGAHNGVGTRVPTGSYYAHGVVCLGDFIEGAAELYDAGVDVERIDGVDAEGQALFGIAFDAARGRSQDGDIDFLEF